MTLLQQPRSTRSAPQTMNDWIQFTIPLAASLTFLSLVCSKIDFIIWAFFVLTLHELCNAETLASRTTNGLCAPPTSEAITPTEVRSSDNTESLEPALSGTTHSLNTPLPPLPPLPLPLATPRKATHEEDCLVACVQKIDASSDHGRQQTEENNADSMLSSAPMPLLFPEAPNYDSSNSGSALSSLTSAVISDEEDIMSSVNPSDDSSVSSGSSDETLYDSGSLHISRKLIEVADEVDIKSMLNTLSALPVTPSVFLQISNDASCDTDETLSSGTPAGTPDDSMRNEEETDEEETDEDDDDDEEDDFAEVKEALNLEAIKETALQCRARQCDESQGKLSQAGKQLTCDIDSEPLEGGFNLVYTIRWSDGVKWVARVPAHGCSFGILDAAKMQCEYDTMQYIRDHTSIPIPQVFYYTWTPIHAGAPFALMSHLEGKMLYEFWQDPSTTEGQKLDTLNSIAAHMTELSKLGFSDPGSLYVDQSTRNASVKRAIQPFWGGASEGCRGRWNSSSLKPQFKSLKEALSDHLEKEVYLTKRARCVYPVLQLAIASIPEFLDVKDRYTISPPDFDWQNIMVNDAGEVTGFIDWDNVEIRSMATGVCKYPRWLTGDWLDWNQDEDHTEEDGKTWRGDSAEKLSLYRQHYSEAMAISQGPGFDQRLTQLSHILETVTTAVFEGTSAGDNINKLFYYTGVPFHLVDYGNEYMEDQTTEKDHIIQKAFSLMWHAEWEVQQETDATRAITLV